MNYLMFTMQYTKDGDRAVVMAMLPLPSSGDYRNNLLRYFIAIAFRYHFIAINFSLSLLNYQYRDTFVPKSEIIDNKIQQVIEKQFHT